MRDMTTATRFGMNRVKLLSKHDHSSSNTTCRKYIRIAMRTILILYLAICIHKLIFILQYINQTVVIQDQSFIQPNTNSVLSNSTTTATAIESQNTTIARNKDSSFNSLLIQNINNNNNNNNNQPLKRLEFVHITKTGGSAIETIASQHGIIWGACHFSHLPKIGCYSPSLVPWQEYYIGTAWHAPPKVIHALIPTHQNPYFDADLFAVVRNPYDRVVSEYYCPFFGNTDDVNQHEPSVMNEWIQNMILELEKELPIKYYYKSPNTRKFPSKKHFVNQVEYIYDYDGDNNINNGIRVIKHVLYFENLNEDFDYLMQSYGLDFHLPDKHTNGVNKGEKKLTYRDLYPETVEAINRYASRDFELLGYKMVDSFKDNVPYTLSPLQRLPNTL